MLRASSEMAVATRVASLAEKPLSSASALPLRRATTRSTSEETAAHVFSLRSCSSFGIPELPFEVGDALFEIERRGDVLQGDPELHHGERHLRLYPHDHRLRTAQPDHVGEIAHRPRGEGIED